jgi:hypothetical protein
MEIKNIKQVEMSSIMITGSYKYLNQGLALLYHVLVSEISGHVDVKLRVTFVATDVIQIMLLGDHYGRVEHNGQGTVSSQHNVGGFGESII